MLLNSYKVLDKFCCCAFLVPSMLSTGFLSSYWLMIMIGDWSRYRSWGEYNGLFFLRKKIKYDFHSIFIMVLVTPKNIKYIDYCTVVLNLEIWKPRPCFSFYLFLNFFEVQYQYVKVDTKKYCSLHPYVWDLWYLMRLNIFPSHVFWNVSSIGI